MAIITLTTDFGCGSPYVAEMKGVLLSLAPAVTIVDITHAVEPQNVLHGALVLRQVTPRFPPGSIHLAVVDPQVGTDRAILLVEADGRHYVAPDNGLLSLLTWSRPRVWRLTRSETWLQPVSATFQGRDIMSPVAASLALGVPPDSLGEPTNQWQRLAWPEPTWDEQGRLCGEIVMADSFGNLVTNIHRHQLARSRPAGDPSSGGKWEPLSSPAASPAGAAPVVGGRWQVEVATGTSRGAWQQPRWVATYGQANPGDLVALIGSSGWLEIACVQGDARHELGLKRTDFPATCVRVQPLA